ncbi:MAG: SAM-dependent DNA methyltransferase, partial [Anaerolineae bacterium]|nr:SAM-dependent DNA methyltransferase [Anaerolineae bacterium]
GFRRFKLGEDGADLRVLHVDDMVALKPFEGAANRTSVFVVQRGAPTKYPVPYTVWTRKKGASIGMDVALEEAQAATARANLVAVPVDRTQATAPWITARPNAIKALGRVLGQSNYRAEEGANTGGANGVYWVRVLSKRADGLIVIENLHDIGKKDIPKAPPVAVEPDLVHQLLRGRDVSRWRATPSVYLLIVQDPDQRMGYDENWMKQQFPATYAYLRQFEPVLSARPLYRKYFNSKSAPFYSMYNVSPHTFAPYKIVWKYVSVDLTCAVIGTHADPILGEKTIIPDHRLMLVPLENQDEAHFICALLNSSIANLIVKGYVIGTQISTHILENISIPKYDSHNPLHQELSSLSEGAHELAARGENEVLKEVEGEIDRKAAELWGITDKELAEIKHSLAELS